MAWPTSVVGYMVSLMDVRHVIREALGRSRLGKLALDLSSDMVGKWQLETMHKGLDLLI